MPVQIGAKAHSYSDPMGLLSDCHRRIEMFLGSLQKIGELLDQPLGEDARAALDNALRYFREAAPKHTADEERSLFPRLREVSDSEVAVAIAALDELEAEHQWADCLHAQVEVLGNKCLERGSLSAADAIEFRRAVGELQAIYQRHIGIEDDVVFPAATRVLGQTEKAAIAAEMAARRK